MTTDNERTKREEQAYVEGKRAAMLELAAPVLRALRTAKGELDADAQALAADTERHELIRVLRTWSAEYERNDWSDGANLADVVDDLCETIESTLKDSSAVDPPEKVFAMPATTKCVCGKTPPERINPESGWGSIHVGVPGGRWLSRVFCSPACSSATLKELATVIDDAIVRSFDS